MGPKQDDGAVARRPAEQGSSVLRNEEPDHCRARVGERVFGPVDVAPPREDPLQRALDEVVGAVPVAAPGVCEPPKPGHRCHRESLERCFVVLAHEPDLPLGGKTLQFGPEVGDGVQRATQLS
jgi:hypothetical protein